MARSIRTTRDSQKPVIDIFDSLAYRHSRWAVWTDFVAMAACSLSNLDKAQQPKREEMYLSIAKKYSRDDLEQFAAMFAAVVEALEEDCEQDFLGDLFMRLELGNEAHGQFFTPYHVCDFMAKMTFDDAAAEVERRGYISVNDPCCGAGALLVAFANECRRQEINFQTSVLFVAQDIDITAALMCYIQLSLLGCAGYVIIGNTLTTPPTEPLRNQNVWYTPMKIYSQKQNALNETDRLELAKLLIKAGYAVRIGSEKPEGKPNGANIYYVEYSEGGKEFE